MKMRVLGKLKSHLVCALAAGLVLSMQVSCGSSSDSDVEQEVGLEAASDTDAENDAPLNNSEEMAGSENEYLNEANATESMDSANASLNEGIDNFESVNGDGAAPNETAEMIAEGAGDAMMTPESDPMLEAAAGSDPFATSANSDPFAANSTEADPFAAPSGEANTSPAVASTDYSEPQANTAPVENVASDVSLSTPSQGYVPEDGARMAYIIQVGDSMAGIARKIYGNSNNWRTLAEENRITNANLIYAGDVIYYSLDSKTRNFAQSYETSPRKSVTVRAGDSLSSIAEQVYGSQGSWRSLWKENPQVSNPDQLTVGMVLSYRATGGMATMELPSDTVGSQVASASMDMVIQE